MILSFLYFIFPACAILYYGIGNPRVILVSDELSDHTLGGVKAVFSVVSSTVLTYLFSNALLAPYSLSEFFPFAALFIFISISILIEVIVRITAKRTTAEFTVSFLIIILSVGESLSLPEAIFIALSCILSFYLVAFLIFIIKRRISIAKTPASMTNSSLVFLTLAFLMIILCVTNVSFLNPGVLK